VRQVGYFQELART